MLHIMKCLLRLTIFLFEPLWKVYLGSNEWILKNLYIFRTAYQTQIKVIICAVICGIIYKLFIIAERKKPIFSFKKQPYKGKVSHFLSAKHTRESVAVTL